VFKEENNIIEQPKRKEEEILGDALEVFGVEG
jgi:hypothetical protein